ncbi:hypothetical protein [Campylobacter sp. MIT 97-5078]|uniref:hypothetical protein n=1 Tax=Campylobacter sp. MIT 97-5078 TaxID=1548153 RepID=UPI00051461AB|nr:hypothetical protein [Campylobacter sp. MIT 97-5078]KGI55256.1 hypothetical protein LR59_12780 [Campylobacter sp. MIT 97-5078]TQR25560.1 hypothetical protein DMB91_07070 [Campylobacter sp. MIT 97-5078]
MTDFLNLLLTDTAKQKRQNLKKENNNSCGSEFKAMELSFSKPSHDKKNALKEVLKQLELGLRLWKARD